MSKIKMVPFNSVLKDNTSKFTKIKKQDYLEKGTYKIIDQGQSFVAGFTNDSNCVNNFDAEVIIFGDHTRIFKFINFPIAIGADGVKVLEVINKDEYDVKFLYYYLKSVKLHDAGYSRHFKFLKEIKIPLLPLQDQQKIAQLLTQIEELINKREESIKLLDELTKSTFLEMFGDPGINRKNFPIKKFGEHIEYIGDIGSNGSNANISANLEMLDTEDYAIMVRTVNLNANDFKNNIKYVSKKTYDYFKKSKIYGGEIIMNKIGSAGKIWIMPNLNRPVSLGLNQLMIRLKELNTNYLYYLLSTDYGQMIINSKVNGAVTKSITKGAVKELPLLYPPVKLQNKFSEIVTQLENTKTIYQNSLTELNNLFGAIAQKAFRGENVKKKIEKIKTYKSLEDRLKSVEKEFIFQMDKIMDNKSQTDLTTDDEKKAVALTLGYKFGFYDDESIKLIDNFLDSEEFLVGDKSENELINKILEKHPHPKVFASFIKDDQSKNDEVKIIRNVVNRHSYKDVLINPLINLIFEKEQNLRIRYASSELIADYDNLSEETIKDIIEIIYNEEKIEEEVRLHTAYAFTDKINISLELYEAIYWILRKQSTSLLSNKEVFIHFLKKEFEEKKESLAFDTLVKNIAYDSRKMTAYKMFLFDLLKYDIDSEPLNNYDYKALKDDIFRLIKEKKIIQKLNPSTYEINLFWNVDKLEEK